MHNESLVMACLINSSKFFYDKMRSLLTRCRSIVPGDVQPGENSVSVLTQLSKAAGVAMSSEFPAHQTVDMDDSIKLVRSCGGRSYQIISAACAIASTFVIREEF